MISVNNRAAAVVAAMIEAQEELGLGVTRLDNGATVIDAGIVAPGSLEAGRMFAVACMGGLGRVHFVHNAYDAGTIVSGGCPESWPNAGFWLPAVTVDVDRPHLACMASQYAGWAVRKGSFSAIGSGPARALACEEEIFRKIEYRDTADTAVMMFEGRTVPDSAVAAHIAEKCGVQPENVRLLIAPTASLVGSVQIAARSVETCLHKLMELGFDIRRVTAAYGTCPLAPVAADDIRAMGRTNDAILYGSMVFIAVDAGDEEVADLIESIPSSSSRDYGTSFLDLFKRYGGDFYKIDRMLFSPARVEINAIRSGRVFGAGRVNRPLLKASLLE
ncbi:MAG TPA: methenyltetrahydromethanopterin cyclohydrolase [Acidobacteriota bacterium]|nr:methenyltetrahydromethanopterin cyclohydrolase [Acidobacteriota bacterium]